MPIDTKTPHSPGWWFRRLHVELHERTPSLTKLENYYLGDPPLPTGPENVRDAYRRFQRKARANWAGLVVDAVRERMAPVAFATGNAELDARVWEIMAANDLPAQVGEIHRTSLTMRDAYLMVGDVDPEIGAPLITAEDPREVITAHDPRVRRRVLAAVKVWRDEINGASDARLFVAGDYGKGEPAVLYRLHRSNANLTGHPLIDMEAWNWDGEPEELDDHVVPVYRFPNRPNLRGASRGEFEDVLDDLDRINLMLLQRLVIAVMQAFRQRAVKGLPEFDERNERIDWQKRLPADPGALWALPAEVDVWESAGVDLTPILESVKADVRDLAATTRTPMHYLFPDAANGSAEGASLQREGLIHKVHDRLNTVSGPWQRVASRALAVDGRDVPAMRVVWAPPERFSLAERYDAAVKAIAAGVPWRTVMSDVLQFGPEEIARMEAERAADALVGGGLAMPTFDLEAEESAPSGDDAAALKAKADAFGALIRAGVSPESAAQQAGLTGLVFTGAVPVSLRQPEEKADNLEEK